MNEQYKPAPEEIKKAEDSMTDKQKEASEKRLNEYIKAEKTAGFLNQYREEYEKAQGEQVWKSQEAYYTAEEVLKKNITPEKANALIELNGKDISPELMADKTFVLELIRYNAFMIKFASNELKKDMDVAKKILETGLFSNGANAIEYVDKSLLSNKNTLLELMNYDNCRAAFVWASPEMKADKDIVKLAFKGRGMMALELKNTSAEIQDDKDMVLLAVRECGPSLEYASDRLKNDREIVIEAIKNDGSALEFVSENFKNDKEIVHIAITEGYRKYHSWDTLSYASPELKADRETVLKAIAEDGHALICASGDLRADKEMALLALEKMKYDYGCHSLFDALSPDLKKDEEVLAAYNEALKQEYENEKENWEHR